MIDDPRGAIDYEEGGQGPTVVLVPGSCSTGAVWRPILAQWHDDFRWVTTSLLGYGGTAERRTLNVDIGLEAECIEAVVRRADGPVHLVGHSFGGLAALAVAIRRRVPLQSLTIIEAPATEILWYMGERGHYRAFRAMSDGYIEAFFAGEKEAIAAMIDFYGGAGTFAAWPERVRAHAVATTAVNVLDWVSAYGFALDPTKLARVEVPTLVIRGEASHPAVQRANELLARGIADATLTTIRDASHFLITTHARQAAIAIARHVVCAEDVDGREVTRCVA